MFPSTRSLKQQILHLTRLTVTFIPTEIVLYYFQTSSECTKQPFYQVTRDTISQPSVEMSYEESHPDHGNPMARLPHRTMRFPQNIMAIEKNARTQKLHRDGYLPCRALPPMPPPEVFNRIQNKKRGEWRMRLRSMSTPPTWEPNMGSLDAMEGTQAPAPKHRNTLVDTRMKFYDTKPDGWVNSRDAWQNQFYQHAGKTEVTDVALGW